MKFEQQTGKTIEEAFWEFHRANPQIYQLFKRFAFRMIEQGHTMLSSKLIINRIRWEVYVETITDDPYKINDAFTAYYSRLFVKRNPEYENYFEFRELRS